MAQLIVRQLGTQEYDRVWQAMRRFTDQRDEHTVDEIWLVEHPAVFTQGQAGKAEHLLMPGDIPVVQVDRGGQVTYHGPGQLVGYLLLDLRRLEIGVRDLVTLIEQSIVSVLADFGICSQPKAEAPGVYVPNSRCASEAKIAQLGLRVRRGCSYHGLSLNIQMDLEPFSRINPCGYQGLAVTDMHTELDKDIDRQAVGQQLIDELHRRLGYTDGYILADGLPEHN